MNVRQNQAVWFTAMLTAMTVAAVLFAGGGPIALWAVMISLSVIFGVFFGSLLPIDGNRFRLRTIRVSTMIALVAVGVLLLL